MSGAREGVPFRSIRFRLTLWYTLLLAIVLIAVSLGLSALLGRELRADADERLLRTATAIRRDVTAEPTYGRGAFQVGQFRIGLPEIDPIALPGQVVQVVNAEGEVVAVSGGQDPAPLPFAPLVTGDAAPGFRTGTLGIADIRTVRAPLVTREGGVTLGAIVVAESLEPLQRTLRLVRRLILAASIVGIGLAAVGGWALAGRALRPVDKVTATAATIAAGGGAAASLATRLAVPATRDEIARLAITFNAMLDRLETAFATQRRFVADASHELRTPLAAIRGNVDVMLRQTSSPHPDQPPDDRTEALADMQRESARMARLLDDLLLLARADAPAPAIRTDIPPPEVRLDLVAREALRTATRLAAGQTLTISAVPATITGDADQLHRLVLNLLENALRHTPPEGAVEITVAVDARAAHLMVRDTGEGIAPDHLPHLFERFYRVDGARARATGGSGLGLAIVRTIARGHGGEIAVRSTLGVGSTFTATFPARRDAILTGDLDRQ